MWPRLSRRQQKRTRQSQPPAWAEAFAGFAWSFAGVSLPERELRTYRRARAGQRSRSRKRSIMSNAFENKVALVTGGSTGIGAAVALELAERGAQVVVTGRTEATLRASAARHARIEYLISDIAKPADAARAVDYVRNKWDRLDVLVNNAGIAEIVPLEHASSEHVQRIL